MPQNKTLKLSLICLVLSCLSGYSQNNTNLNNFIQILGKIESNNNDFIKGDGGKALGRYQIWKDCYTDAKEFNKNITFSYESLTNSNNSRQVLISYLTRYESKALKENDFEKLSKCWNGGCGWRQANNQKKINLEIYWNKIKKELDKNK